MVSQPRSNIPPTTFLFKHVAWLTIYHLAIPSYSDCVWSGFIHRFKNYIKSNRFHWEMKILKEIEMWNRRKTLEEYDRIYHKEVPLRSSMQKQQRKFPRVGVVIDVLMWVRWPLLTLLNCVLIMNSPVTWWKSENRLTMKGEPFQDFPRAPKYKSCCILSL